MMNPKQKAKELVDKFRNEYKWLESDYQVDLYRDAKQCALIAVEEKIESVLWLIGSRKEMYTENEKETLQELYEVKNEINKL